MDQPSPKANESAVRMEIVPPIPEAWVYAPGQPFQVEQVNLPIADDDPL